MTEQATLYLIKLNDFDFQNNSTDGTAGTAKHLISVKEGKKLRTIKEYVNTRKELKNSIIKENIKNYEIVFFKKIKFGSTYEHKRILDYYKKELGISLI